MIIARNGLLCGVPAVHLSNANCKVLRIRQRDLSPTHPDTVTLPQCCLKWNWLPVKFRICYKIVVISFKAIHNLAPMYLSNLINIKRCPRYNLRSNVGGNCKTKTLPLSPNALFVTGDRSFTAAAPRIWNGLPDYIRKENDFDQFKRLIKTHYFKEAHSYPSLAIVGFYILLLSSLFTSYLLWVMLNYLLERKCNNWLSFSMYRVCNISFVLVLFECCAHLIIFLMLKCAIKALSMRSPIFYKLVSF